MLFEEEPREEREEKFEEEPEEEVVEPYPEIVEYVRVREPMAALTKFERARVLEYRARMLTNGASPTIDVKKYGLVHAGDIARKELELGKMPLLVRRRLPSNVVRVIPLYKEDAKEI